MLGISFWTTAETLLRRAPIQLNFHSFTAHDSWETGLEDVHVVERKISLVHSCTGDRKAFINRLRLMARYPHRLLVITSTLSQVKSPYSHASVDPNRTTQFLVAVLAGLQVPFICSETHELGEELVGSYLYQVHLYHWLESHDYGRFLADNDL